jgi:hypothetical protein
MDIEKWWKLEGLNWPDSTACALRPAASASRKAVMVHLGRSGPGRFKLAGLGQRRTLAVRNEVVTTPWAPVVARLLCARQRRSRRKVFTSATSNERGVRRADSCGWGLTVYAVWRGSTEERRFFELTVVLLRTKVALIGSYNNVGKRGCEKRINWKRKLPKDRSHQ